MTNFDFIQQLVIDWGLRTFGTDVMNNRRERALRVVEEALELGQASGVPIELVDRLVNEVYSRPPNPNPERELGGLIVTAMVVAGQHGTTLTSQVQLEVLNVLDTDPERYKKRMQEKIDRGVSAV